MRSVRSAFANFAALRTEELEPGPGGVELTNRQSRSGTTIHGWPSVIFGLAFVAAGLGMMAAGLGGVAPRAGGSSAPRWLIAVFGAPFALAGASFLIHGLRGARRMAWMRRARDAHPAEPWRWDHQWDERGARDDTGSVAGQSLAGAVFMLVFLAPFHWVGFFARDRSIVFGIVALLFDVLAVVLIARAAYLFARRLKYGHGIALFGQFPFRRGKTLELHVQAPPALPQHAVANATLRCIQERYVTRGSGKNRRTTVVCFELYRDAVPAELVDAGPGVRALRVRFALPSDVPITDLASRPCRYWEIDVEAGTDGVDYAARYLVPVY